MNQHLPDIDLFEQLVFKKKNPLDLLLSYSLKLMKAKHVGLLFGTDRTGLKFLSPERWDRAVMHKFNGKGLSGLILKYFGTHLVKLKGFSPVRLYRDSYMGEKFDNEGIIPFVLRKHKDFYKQGLKILIINNLRKVSDTVDEKYSKGSILSYDGTQFLPFPDLKMNTGIVRLFQAQNFISAYVPDYGAIVFNTVDPELFGTDSAKDIPNQELEKRLNLLISAIEMASLSNIGLAKGRQAAHLIWRKEKNLRKTALQLKDKEIELNAQKAYLRAVGAVNAKQLDMDAVSITDGVYAFMDMVGSVMIRQKFMPGDYFFILNLCHQIAADNANRFNCRVDNFIGDCVFVQNISVFDDEKLGYFMGAEERGMLMILAMASIFNQIEQLKNGTHQLDRAGQVKRMIKEAGVNISFRAGMEMGPAMVGPLGSQKRKIVTAIGEAVNNASRLESSGVPGKIHISEKMMALFKTAQLTNNTKMITQALLESEGSGNPLYTKDTGSFMDCYQSIFKIQTNVVQQRNNVTFKEFSKKTSYLLKCFPDPESQESIN
ncbi:MAG: adenylate/guanylate cyclase domain-containing protein [Pseudomonadota bacterium]